jgi:hypothetical protein
VRKDFDAVAHDIRRVQLGDALGREIEHGDPPGFVHHHHTRLSRPRQRPGKVQSLDAQFSLFAHPCRSADCNLGAILRAQQLKSHPPTVRRWWRGKVARKVWGTSWNGDPLGDFEREAGFLAGGGIGVEHAGFGGLVEGGSDRAKRGGGLRLYRRSGEAK